MGRAARGTDKRQVGRYLLQERVGVGGMGEVYRAFDTTLRREVALKCLVRRNRSVGRVARLRREAQALARLSHPNVVTVFDVVEEPGDDDEPLLYIAMEFVHGQTLRRWCAEPHSRSTTLRVLVEAGWGLAAAHGAGLLHRDFKPSNVMVGADGRARVMDFGLARTAESRSEEPELETVTSPGMVDDPLTAQGQVMGTPAYMPPEQHRGQVDARGDQFAFCVTAYEALYGSRPYDADTAEEQLRAKDAGRVEPPPPRGPPPGVFDVLRRGLNPDPAQRWATMDELLAALEHERGARQWLKYGLLGAAVAALATVVAWPTSRPACNDSQLAGVWDDARRAQLHDGFMATQLAHADATFGLVVARLDVYARRWTDAHTPACSAAADLARDAVLACLSERRTELQALVETLIEADGAVVDNAVGAAVALQDPRECTASEFGDKPVNVAVRGAVKGLLARAKAKMEAGRYADGLVLAAEGLERAQRSGQPRLVAEAHLRMGDLHRSQLAWHESADSLERAYFAAREASADALAAQACIGLIAVHGRRLSDADAAARWTEHARAALAKVDGPELEGDFELALGLVAGGESRFEDALAHYARALAVDEPLFGEDDPRVGDTLANIGAIHHALGNYEVALRYSQQALERYESALGPSHPKVGMLQSNLGALHHELRRYEQARDHLRRALAVREARLGAEHPGLVAPLTNLGATLFSLGEDDAALAAYRRALSLLEHSGDADPRVLADVLNNIGIALGSGGDPQAGLRQHERALVVIEAAFGDKDPRYGLSLRHVGGALVDLGEFARGIETLDRALANLEATVGGEHRYAAEVLFELGRAHAGQGNPDKAVDVLRRSLDVEPRPATRFVLARALWDAGRDRAGALALARAARDAYAQRDPPTGDGLARVEAWLASHGQDGA